MRFPFVSRALFDTVAAESRAAIASALDARDAERAERLADRDAVARERAEWASRFTMLKLQGFTETPAPLPVPEGKPVDLVQAAIARTAGRHTARKRAMQQQALRDEAAGMSQLDIVARIERGVTFDEASE